MKTLGLLGGLSWESTVPYYRIINETVRERLGGLHSAPLILYRVDFHAIERLQQADAWEEAGHQWPRCGTRKCPGMILASLTGRGWNCSAGGKGGPGPGRHSHRKRCRIAGSGDRVWQAD